MIDVYQCQRYKKNNKYGLINKYIGEQITKPIFDDLRRIHGTDFYFKFSINNLWGVISTSGKLVLKPLYQEICYYDQNFFTVIYDGRVTHRRIHKNHSKVPFIKDNGYWEPDEYEPPRFYSRFNHK